MWSPASGLGCGIRLTGFGVHFHKRPFLWGDLQATSPHSSPTLLKPFLELPTPSKGSQRKGSIKTNCFNSSSGSGGGGSKPFRRTPPAGPVGGMESASLYKSPLKLKKLGFQHPPSRRPISTGHVRFDSVRPTCPDPREPPSRRIPPPPSHSWSRWGGVGGVPPPWKGQANSATQTRGDG